jgi:type I restriction enzyme R subunit
MRQLVEEAVQPVAANPELRARLLEIRRAHDITYDEVNRDELLSAAGVDPRIRAQQVVTDWRAYLAEHRDEITAIELGFRHDRSGRAVYAQLKELAARLRRPPQTWTPDKLWQAYERLELAAKRPGVTYGAVDLIGLIRYELGTDAEPRPHRSLVEERFAGWLLKQQQSGVRFSGDQVWWLERIRDVVITSASFDHTDLDHVPFTERGGTDGFLRAFGDDRAEAILTDLTQDLAA